MRSLNGRLVLLLSLDRRPERLLGLRRRLVLLLSPGLRRLVLLLG